MLFHMILAQAQFAFWGSVVENKIEWQEVLFKNLPKQAIGKIYGKNCGLDEFQTELFTLKVCFDLKLMVSTCKEFCLKFIQIAIFA